jgi:predicted HTH domain antitoxin
MEVTISDEILAASQLTREEFLQEIALHLFASRRLNFGYTCQMAQMEPLAFRALLKSRKIPLYDRDIEDLGIDLKGLRELGRL